MHRPSLDAVRGFDRAVYGVAGLLWPTLVVGCVGVALGLLRLERALSPAENGAVGGEGAAQA